MLHSPCSKAPQLFVYFSTPLFHSRSLATFSALLRTPLHQQTESILKMSSPTEPTAHIEDLPPEMINELFKYLGLKDLATCSLVNKRWHSIYAGFKLHSLAAFDEDDDFSHYESSGWIYPAFREVEEAERCPPAMFGRLAEKPLLSNLKRLAVFGPASEFDLNKLNLFSQLLQLEVNIIDYHEENTRVHLNLPKLKVLVLYHSNSCSLSVDSPELSTLVYDDEYDEGTTLLHVKQPETIRKLDTNMTDPKWLASFKNIECLVTWNFQAICKATLHSLPRLRELHYNGYIQYTFEDDWREFTDEPITVDQMKRALNEFMDEAKKLRGDDFQFRFIGFQLTSVNVDQINFGVQVNARGEERLYNECVYMKNYHLIEPGAMQFALCIDYARLLNNVTGEFPCCFSQKFTGIIRVEATAQVRDAGHFLWFLKSLKTLRKLELANTVLGQEFYDQLPVAARSLSGLHLKDGHCKNGLQLNFDFIGELSNLSELEVHPAVSLESTTLLVRLLGRLKKGRFLVPSKEDIEIIKKRNSKWEIVKSFKVLFETENPEEIVNYFDRLQ